MKWMSAALSHRLRFYFLRRIMTHFKADDEISWSLHYHRTQKFVTYINVDARQWENFFRRTLRGWISIKLAGSTIELQRQQRCSIQVVQAGQCGALSSSYATRFDDEPYWSYSTITETWNDSRDLHMSGWRKWNLMARTYLFHISCRC